LSEYIWALKDINFEVKQGEVLGIIGRNGAGKSTLLKILSRTTSPTTGNIKIKGRVASLLEVGTGFHPELTGRENIFLNGVILGMHKPEIKQKFDEIVDFSGVERYIDTPVKRYSSGMYVRLAFAVAAHLEPEILIVDEVLAVGDTEFQRKALGKMKDVSNKEGRTVLFVSHNTAAIRSLCSKGMILINGKITYSGDVEEAVMKYLRRISAPAFEFTWTDSEVIHGIKLRRFFIKREDGSPLTELTTDHDIKLCVEHEVSSECKRFGFTVGFWNEFDELIFLTLNNRDHDFSNPKSPGIYTSSCIIPASFLNDRTYHISLNIFDANYSNGVTFKDVLTISVHDGASLRKDYIGGFQGMIRPSLKWDTVKIK
jgi:lipopolysaccharide transport system ATP-binding protein